MKTLHVLKTFIEELRRLAALSLMLIPIGFLQAEPVLPAQEKPAAPVASVTHQPTCEVATGTITVTSPAPAEGITFSINGVDYTNTSGVFTNVVSGTYNVTVKNAAGYVSSPTSVTVNASPGKPAAPIADQWPDRECNLAVIRVTEPVPAEGITYSIDGVNYFNHNVFTLRGISSGTYYVTVKNAAGCISEATPVSVTVYSSVPPVADVTQPTCYVATGSITVTSPDPAPGLTYLLSGLSHEYSNTSGIFTGIEPGTYDLRVSSGCLSDPSRVTINPAQETPPVRPSAFMDSTTYVCAVATARYQVRADPGVNYIWSYSGEGTVIETPFDSGTWLLFAENATSGTLSVVATSECGTSEARTIEITVRQLPGPAEKVSGPTEVCPGTRGVVYSVPVIPNAVHYLWNLPYGATIVGGYDTNTITIDFSEEAVPGVITVQGSKLCGTGAVSPELHIAGGNSPAQPGEFWDFTENICHGSSALYSIQSQPGLTYNWSFSGTGATINAISINLMSISFAEGATSGTLSVVAVNDCGNSIPRSRYITVRPLPGPAGTITGPASVTTGSKGIVYTVPVIPNAVNYIWTLPAGATIVSGANTNSITVDFADDAFSGSITVQGSKSCGTGAVSPALQVTVTKPVSVKKALESGDIGIYPVPNKGAFNITFDTEGEKDVTIMVFNSSGIKVFEMKNVIISERTELPFDLSALPAGLYFMKFYDGPGEISKTIILSR